MHSVLKWVTTWCECLFIHRGSFWDPGKEKSIFLVFEYQWGQVIPAAADSHESILGWAETESDGEKGKIRVLNAISQYLNHPALQPELPLQLGGKTKDVMLKPVWDGFLLLATQSIFLMQEISSMKLSDGLTFIEIRVSEPEYFLIMGANNVHCHIYPLDTRRIPSPSWLWQPKKSPHIVKYPWRV